MFSIGDGLAYGLKGYRQGELDNRADDEYEYGLKKRQSDDAYLDKQRQREDIQWDAETLERERKLALRNTMDAYAKGMMTEDYSGLTSLMQQYDENDGANITNVVGDRGGNVQLHFDSGKVIPLNKGQFREAMQMQFEPATWLKIARDKGSKFFSPVGLVNRETGEKKWGLPTGDMTTGQAGITPLQTPDGFEVVTEMPNEKRLADVQAAGLKKRVQLEAEKEIKPDTEKKVALAKTEAKIANEAFTQVGKIQKNIRNLEEVVRLVDEEGAETGPISKILPTIRSATVQLENMQKELGLDVVGSVTFGALSKGELDLALNKALPTNLDGPELVKWTKAKIYSQKKLAQYFREQAIFLSDGGSQSEWMKSKMPKESDPVKVGRFSVKER